MHIKFDIVGTLKRIIFDGPFVTFEIEVDNDVFEVNWLDSSSRLRYANLDQGITIGIKGNIMQIKDKFRLIADTTIPFRIGADLNESAWA